MSKLQWDFFDRFAPAYGDDRIRPVLDAIRRKKVSSFLDVGCGDGSNLRLVADAVPGIRVAGLDPSPVYVEKARASGLDSVFAGNVLEDLPSELDGSFDVILLASVLHHLVEHSARDTRRNWVLAIQRCLGSLSSEGSLYVFEPLREPRILVRGVYEIKKWVIRAYGNRRVHLGARWANIGAPLVYFLDEPRLNEAVEAAGGVIRNRWTVDDRRLGGLLRNYRAVFEVCHATT